MSVSTNSVHQSLIAAGVIDASDVEVGRNDDTISGGARLSGGDGDDVLVGTAGVAESFFFDGRDDNNDEGRHVDVVQGFEIGRDSLDFRLDGRFFDGMDQARNGGNVANFTSARDLADLMLHVNRLDGAAEGIGKSVDQSDIDDATAANGKVDKAFRDATKAARDDGSFVKVVDGNVVFNFDDGQQGGEEITLWGEYKTDDIMVAFEGLADEIGSAFARELGYADEFESRQDSLHIASTAGGRLDGGDGDNLFILSNAADVVHVSRDSNNNDEGEHVNIIHGFDLAMDSLSLSAGPAGTLPGGANNGKFKTYEGAAGLVELLNLPAVRSVDDAGGDLRIEIQLQAFGDAMTIVLTNVTMADVQQAAADQVWSSLVDAGVFEAGEVPAPYRRQDDVDAPFQDAKGDDIMFATSGADSFHFDSGSGREDGTQGSNDGDAHANAIVGFGAADQLTFRIDGGYFEGFAHRGINDNTATVGYDDVDDLAAWINAKGGQNGAFYDAATKSTVLTFDDSPDAANQDDFTIVLYGSGDLL